MSRIIGGEAKGRRLRTPPGEATRPTSDRVREALFSTLESELGSLAGLRVIDLYAGSGAVGLEALSRGAAAATLVEGNRRTAGVVEHNARDLGYAAEVVAQPVARALGSAPAEPYDVVFADPPYPMDNSELETALALLVEHHWLTPGAVVVVERSTRTVVPAWPAGLEHSRTKRYGETVLHYLHAGPADRAD